MKEIICHIAMFDYKHSIYSRSESNDIACVTKVTIEELPGAIAALSDSYCCNHVHLFGNDDYCNSIAQEIKYTLAQEYNYSDEDFIVEVN